MSTVSAPLDILLIEDDAFKAKRILACIGAHFPEAQVRTARSVSSGLSELVESTPGVLLLDMSLSTYDVGPRETGGRPQNFGGITVFEHMARRCWEIPTIVITQYPGFRRDDGAEVSLDTLRLELADRFPNNYRALLSYNPGDRAWEQMLVDKIKENN